MSVKEVPFDNTSMKRMTAELKAGNNLFMIIKDERCRWLGSIYEVSSAQYISRYEMYKKSPGYYGNNAETSALWNVALANNLRGVDGKGKTVDVKFNKHNVAWLQGYEGEAKIIFAPPESRAQNNTFDIFGHKIEVGSLVIGSTETQIYVGNVDRFKVGPSNTFVRIKPIPTQKTPKVPDEISINVNQVILVTKTLQDDILISKLSH